jgi:hypothetical protein
MEAEKISPFERGHPVDSLHAGDIKPEHSPINLLGKVLYRQQPPWEQRRKSIILLCSVVTGVVLGAICVAVILLQNQRH